MENNITTSTTRGAITPYLNFVNVNTTTHIDSRPSTGTYDCGTGNRVCYQLHNGAYLGFIPGEAFDTSDTTASLSYIVDPDGKLTNNQDSIVFLYYFNGRITTRGEMMANTYISGAGPYSPAPGIDPTWFSWSN